MPSGKSKVMQLSDEEVKDPLLSMIHIAVLSAVRDVVPKDEFSKMAPARQNYRCLYSD
ncbi:hypothetical protein DFQ29_001428, partial [Apophysomyces sp. BC1021]